MICAISDEASEADFQYFKSIIVMKGFSNFVIKRDIALV